MLRQTSERYEQAICEKALRISVGPERSGGQTAAMGLEAS